MDDRLAGWLVGLWLVNWLHGGLVGQWLVDCLIGRKVRGLLDVTIGMSAGRVSLAFVETYIISMGKTKTQVWSLLYG